MDIEKEIQLLKEKISELESKIQNNNFKAFGRSYSKVGSSDSDFLIKTKGQVKIQWGSKFIDLIKDGKINVDSKVIYKENQIGVKDGIYVIGEEQQVILVVDGQHIDLKGDIGTTYISFLGEQETTSENKYQALKNIGFIYPSIKDINESSLKNGIIYVEQEQKLYIIQNGNLQQFSAKIPNPYTEQITIFKNTDDIGSLIIKGYGINNSLMFDSMYIYSKENEAYMDMLGSLYMRINNQNKVFINDEKSIFYNTVVSQEFQSINTVSGKGFRLYDTGGMSTLEVDNILLGGSVIFPVGSIIMFNGNDIPSGWAICNGENGTPNLLDKFIKASDTAGIEGEYSINQTNTDSGSSTSTEENSTQLSTTNEETTTNPKLKYYSLIYIMKINQ